MTTVVLSTPQMAQQYAERTGLQYDVKMNEIGGGEYICYDDSGFAIYTIKFYAPPTQDIQTVKVWEIYNPNDNRFEEYPTYERMLEDFDYDQLHIPYVTVRSTFANGNMVVTRKLIMELQGLPFSAELLNLQGHVG